MKTIKCKCNKPMVVKFITAFSNSVEIALGCINSKCKHKNIVINNPSDLIDVSLLSPVYRITLHKKSKTAKIDKVKYNKDGNIV